MEFSEFCLETRLKLNLSQEMLARKLDVSFATINRWENGKTLPQKLTLYRFKKLCAENKIKFDVELIF
ncbi:MAG: helix-turn-helix domain-containing protein [Bacilli bacterium]|nr:helix-turn-helix domain-containing protein [Bacilli bacterium]